MADEMVLAMEPVLWRLEPILFWHNKLKTAIVFTCCHFWFWFFKVFNVRTYCVLACLLLAIHIVDAYRNKKRRQIQQIRHSPAAAKKMSTIGRYILAVCDRAVEARQRLYTLKQAHRVRYLACTMCVWSALAVVGLKVSGFYLAYMLFWLVFFVPCLVYHDLFGNVLRRALPLLEQLDHSMNYERRSILDRKQLLVDVRTPASFDDGMMNDEQEDEFYLKAFRIDDVIETREKNRRIYENLDDDDDDDNVEEEDETGASGRGKQLSTTTSQHHQHDDDLSSFLPNDTYNPRVDGDETNEDEDTDNDVDIAVDVEDDDDEDDEDELENNVFMNSRKLQQLARGDKVLKHSRGKQRPNVMAYYETSSATTSAATAAETRRPGEDNDQNTMHLRQRRQQQQQQQQRRPVGTGTSKDIDDTFDFLDEY